MNATLPPVDPEIAPALPSTLVAQLPDADLTALDVRALDERMVGTVVGADVPVVRVPRDDGSHLELRVHARGTTDAALLWIHGGGMFLGEAVREDSYCRRLATDLDTTVVAVDYRLAPEHPHPAPLDDCMMALEWLAERYARLVVAGASAGGGLAAGLALRARDAGGPSIAAQHLYYPMLDDRTSSGGPRALDDTHVWNRRLNEIGWAAYLGGTEADEYAAPSRAADLARLPPTYLDVGDLDLFVDECLDYAHRLVEAGVPTEFHLERAAVHGFDLIAPEAAVSRTAADRRIAALRRDLKGPQ